MSTSRRSARRVAMLGASAFLVFGTWAAFANRAHGVDVALRAFAVQGCSSAIVTSTVGGAIEWVHARLPRTAASALLAVAFGVMFASAFHVTLHAVMGTPELLRTVAVPIGSAVVYAVTYVGTLRALDRARLSGLSAARTTRATRSTRTTRPRVPSRRRRGARRRPPGPR